MIGEYKMQSPEERINIIRDAVENIQVADNSLDLNDVSFAAISNADNDGLTVAAANWVKSGVVDNG